MKSVGVPIAVFSASSPSSRRAWIEILIQLLESVGSEVALLAEGVD